MKDDFRGFYDEDGNPISIESKDVLSFGSLFCITNLDRPGENIVGLFIEDDGCYHLKACFSKAWLNDLETVVQKARKERCLESSSIIEEEEKSG